MVEDVEDALQTQPVPHRLWPRRPLGPGRQQRLDQRPQVVVHDPRPSTHTTTNGRIVSSVTPDQATSTRSRYELIGHGLKTKDDFFVAAYRAAAEVPFTEVSRITEPSDGPRGMLNAAMRTYCRLLVANPGPGAGGRVGRLPGDPQGTGRVPHGMVPADGGAGGRAPPRPAGTADGRYRRDRGGCASAGHRHRGGPGPVLDDGILADTSYRPLPARRPGLTSGVGPRTGTRPPARTTGCRCALPDWRAASSPCCRRRRTGPGPFAGGSLRRPTAARTAAEW